jgi:hypothetical protein
VRTADWRIRPINPITPITPIKRGQPIADESRNTRREFIVAAGTASAGLLLTGCSSIAATAEEKEFQEGEAGVTATEDLMREHGVLERVLLIYEEGVRRLEAHEVLLPEHVGDAAMIVRAFVENYHEKQEESDVFPPMGIADLAQFTPK